MSLDKLKTSLEELLTQASAEEVTDENRIKYLGKKGLLKDASKGMKDLTPEERREAGQLLNKVKTELETYFEPRTTNHEQNKWLDVTQPGVKPELGHMHPVSQAIEEVTRIFEGIGFTRARYPEVDWDHYVFEALNMPKNHPARDEWETFFIDSPDHTKWGKMVLTTHTSNGQVREMERVGEPPIRMINIGKTYRRQADATHVAMFHQFEGLVVDKGINIQHLKGVLDYFAKKFYGPEAESRIRPFNFSFTEPSFEVDFRCESEKFSKSGWHEVGGCGMVHPNVLRAGGIDPDVYTGFAFGWGVERTYSLKPGLNIDDIRLIYGTSLDFVSQF